MGGTDLFSIESVYVFALNGVPMQFFQQEPVV
jgi:hypothetical protein